MRCSWLAALIALAACDRPRPLLICHNGNCAGADVSRDDTLPALADSLAQTYSGAPAYDGIELDTFWDRASTSCLFAHDEPVERIPVSVAVQMVADHAAQGGPALWTFFELKAQVGASYSDAHTDEELARHVACVLDARDQLVAADDRVHFGYLSSEPRLLKALAADPRYQAQPVEQMLVADIFAPYSSVVPRLDEYDVPLQGVEFHPDFMTAERRDAYRSLGLDLLEWSYVTTPEMLDAIDRYEPEFVFTSEATLLRRWIED